MIVGFGCKLNAVLISMGKDTIFYKKQTYTNFLLMKILLSGAFITNLNFNPLNSFF